MRKLFFTLCITFAAFAATAQHYKLSPEFKKYKEADDVPGLVERYKDDKCHKYIIESLGRNIESEDDAGALKEGLSLAFDGRGRPVKSARGLYISNGTDNASKNKFKFYYIVYVPKTMETYSIYSCAQDAQFKSYSEKLLKLIESDNSMY